MTKKKRVIDKADKFQEITDKIIEKLEEVEGSWELPWHQIGKFGLPINTVSGKPYNGVNRFYLSIIAVEQGSNVFASYKQWQAQGRQVKGGSTGFPVTFYKPLMVQDRENPEEEKQIPLMRFSTVFCETQLEDYVPPTIQEEENKIEKILEAERVLEALNPKLGEASSAFYRPREDKIYLPPRQNFKSTEAAYSTIFHETIHWTGHEKRCNRNLQNPFGSEGYAKEELIAELGCSFLCQELGITPDLREDHVKYIKSWLAALKDDKKLIFKASAKAQKAVDWINKHSAVQSETAEPAEAVAA